MAKEPRSVRELKKPAQPIPEIPSLGRLRSPRKTNRKAAKLIESGVRLWDRRHVERVARKLAVARNEAHEANRLYRRAVNGFLGELVKRAPGWKLADWQGAIEPDGRSGLSFDVLVENLIRAAGETELRNPEGSKLYFRVAGLTYREHIELRAALPAGISSVLAYHERTATPENGRDFRLHSYDPRESGPLPAGE